MNNIFKQISVDKKLILMAEIKLKSPSNGILGKRGEIKKIAKEYEVGGADMVSVVTAKKYFGGDIKMIKDVKNSTDLPVFCKDFIKTFKQIEEIKKQGASAILLLSHLVTRESLKSLFKKASDSGLTPVVEVDNEKKLREAISENYPVIAVNARNLRNFKVDRNKAVKLLRMIPKGTIVLAFSGIRNSEDVRNYLNVGAKGVLVGTELMKSDNKAEFIRNLRNL